MFHLSIRGAAVIVGVAAIVGLVVFLFRASHVPQSRPSLSLSTAGSAKRDVKSAPPTYSRVEHLPPAQKYLEGQPAFAVPRADELSTDVRSPLADALGARLTPPKAEPQIVLDVLNAYRRSIGSYPAGEGNREIVNALRGANKELLPFLPSDHPRLNANGELVDAWNTPFFFHLISRTSIEVRSAGPDQRMYTADDLVAGDPPPTYSPMDQAPVAE